MTHSLVMDSSTLISLSSNCMLSLFKRLREDFDVEFVIGPSVMSESIERAITSKKFRTEGFRLLELLKKGYILLKQPKELQDMTERVLKEANRVLIAKNNPLHIIHRGEAEVIALATLLKEATILVDERTTRLLVENPASLQTHLKNKLHTPVSLDKSALQRFSECCSGLRVFRSTELVALAFDNDYFKDYEQEEQILNISEKRSKVLEGLLWGLKLNGCAISESEILDYAHHLL
ncbi:hypothetical protein COT72_05300 [archaeon CG10_big_fil_rev_8_21_14_0_10_43_11]|nr:MAG: hypothetical protein COT72_05300 [archaeon CG10_big_fil_rev_8_21_14_0_10_43_11]